MSQMDEGMMLSAASRGTAGILLLTIVGIEFGGWYLLKIVRGRAAVTEFQAAFSRAGHAHAGVLVSLALICQILADSTALTGVADRVAREGVALAAILIPAGFFFSSMGKGVTAPNRLIALIYAGVVALAAGVVALGIGLLTA